MQSTKLMKGVSGAMWCERAERGEYEAYIEICNQVWNANQALRWFTAAVVNLLLSASESIHTLMLHDTRHSYNCINAQMACNCETNT